jgi:predicted Zn-dependent protease
MPELFSRMGESFARNPAGGFPAFLGELSRLEGPALEGVALTPAEERRIGRQARDEYLRRALARGYGQDHDPDRLRYLDELVNGLSRYMTHRGRYPKIDVTLIDAPIADGQSFPGGFLVFTTALLKEPDEATVAAVIAHELAHLDGGHLYEYARRSKLAEATYNRPPGMPGNTFETFFTRQGALLGLMMSPFRPEHEHEADCRAAAWLFQAGYDPAALAEFLDRLARRQGNAPQNPFFDFARSHPDAASRRDHVAARQRQLSRWRPRAELGRFPDSLAQLRSQMAQREAPAAP